MKTQIPALMRNYLKILTVLMSIIFCSGVQAQNGQELFTQKCSACHTIGKGKLVGPDLSGVTKKRPEDWLLKFISSSQTFINSGDAEAKKIFEEFNKVAMPDPGIGDAEIKSILAFIDSQGGSSTASTPVTIKPLSESNPQNVYRGKMLFSGEAPFANGGAACVSCHTIPDMASLGGGTLSKDLTTAYSRLSEAGMVNIIQTQPFPVMKQAFVNHALNEDEVYDVSAYLKSVDESQKHLENSNKPENFFYSGLGGLILLLGVFGGVWHYRRKKSVNHSIYKRQEDYLSNNIFKKSNQQQ